MGVDVAIENDTFVTQLSRCLSSGKLGLSEVPLLLKDILVNGRWRHRKLRDGKIADFDRFEDFITSKPLAGLWTTMDLVRRLIAHDPETVDLLDIALGSHQGERTDIVSNRNDVESRPVGTTKERSIRHLREKAPEIHARVLAGELSPHAGMIEAGFREKSITIPADPVAAARRLARHFSGDQLRELIRALESYRDG
jgi:hypothetical protein